MPYLIGMDEAGYGPNLGPLVVSVSVWEIPEAPGKFDLAAAFSGFVVPTSPRENELQIADSKVVHDPSKGVAALERTVLTAWKLLGVVPESFHQWWPLITGGLPPPDASEPWFSTRDLSLPRHWSPDLLQTLAERWRVLCEEASVRLRTLRSDIVLTRRFNELTTAYDSKGLALSRTSLKLVQGVLRELEPAPTLVIADKHGGRNRYDDLLQEILPDDFIFRVEEGSSRSRYRCGEIEFWFQTRAEAHLPVALASMQCKYLRELSMDLWNDYWEEHVPGLSPTKGYPLDAKRFAKDVAQARERLGIADIDFWRNR